MAEPLLPIRCPKCAHDQVRLFVSSATVLTVTCPACEFTWAIDMASLPTQTRATIAQVIRH